MSEFSSIQMALFNFFEFKVRKSDLFKIREKVDKKLDDFEKSNDKDKGKKQVELDILKEEQINVRKNALKTTIPKWLSECANEARNVGKPMFKVTHPVKFVHGMTPYGGINVLNDSSNNSYLMTTDKLKKHYFDIAMSNGNLITHGRFLLSDLNDKTVYEALEQDDYGWLSEFSTDRMQIEQWANGLKAWLGESEDIEISRLKQIYFHRPRNDNYVLLSPLLSSALAQAIYEKVRFTFFDRENSKRRKAKKNSKYASGELIAFPGVAIMKFGGSQSQNISVRNFERHGEVYLLSCAPPEWHTSLKPPLQNVSVFQGEFNRKAWYLTKELRDYLIGLHQNKSNMRIRKHVRHKVNQIIDLLLNYVSQIQGLKAEQGWSSKASGLKFEYKLWLDMHNEDRVFQEKRREGDWIAIVCRDFGIWLNDRLRHDKAEFEAIESRHWSKLLRNRLERLERREYQE